MSEKKRARQWASNVVQAFDCRWFKQDMRVDYLADILIAFAKPTPTAKGESVGEGKMTDPELNELVARRLGWKPAKMCEYTTNTPENYAYYPDPNRTDEPVPLPNFVGDIGAAFEILNKREQGWALVFNRYTKDYTCTFNSVEATADTAPRAICLAFLKL